ncbi:MAG TPA: type VI secretion system baseplate subunit TssK [Ignavibacteriales bacterium]|nr:type VI secretion system baseplate subunit TssK [Ignavibacteriales bacterium]
MKYQKVIWYEGMKLDPHHFQQTDRYNQYYVNARFGFSNPDQWGINELQIDIAALAGGSFGIVKCSGVMPDGLVFDMPVNDPVPKSRSFSEAFSPTAEKMDVYLSIPIENLSGNNTQLTDTANSHNPRFIFQNMDTLDYNTGQNLRTIGVVKPNFQLRFGTESLDDFSVLKIGEIVRTPEARYLMAKDYIPPVMNISASETLSSFARAILGALISKAKELKSQLNIPKPDLSLTQVEIQMMLLTVNTYIPLLNYYYSAGQIHPENLYVLFLNLAGQLSTFSSSGMRSAEFPPYDHKHLSEVFTQLTDEINSMLHIQKTVSKRDLIVPLRKQGDTLYIGQLSPEQMEAQFFIAAQGDMPERKIISEFPRNIKISSYEEIFAVHQAGIQGVAVEYIARPPAGISINEKAQYFRIIKEGRFWDKIVSKNNIAFFIASEFKSLQMELVLLMPGG